MPISFITPADLLVRYDWRWIGMNVTDSGVAANEAQVLASAKVAAFIQEASEMVLAAATVGDRYSPDDLTTYGGSLLTRIVSDLVMGLILKRRARAAKDEEALTLSYNEALDYLEQLRRGERIFYAVPNVPQAGLPATANLAAPLSIGPPLITDNVRVFGSIGQQRNYGSSPGGFC